MPANVLVADPSSGWMRQGAPLVLHEDLATSRSYLPYLVPDESAVYQLGLSKVLVLTITAWRKKLRVEGVLTDLSSQRATALFHSEGAQQAGLLHALNDLARQLDHDASPFPTANNRALEVFASAAQNPGRDIRAKLLSDAIAIDPNFGLAYVALAEMGLNSGQDVHDLLTRAAGHLSSFTPLDRARLAVVQARAAHSPLAAQELAVQQVLRLAPNNVEALATLASNRFLQSDPAAAEGYIHRALELSPGNLNLRKQLAEGLLANRRYADAEKVFTGINNNPAILPELAVCIFLQGDVARADGVFERFLSLRSAADPSTAFLRAGWLALSGRRSQAIALLSSVQSNDENLRALAPAQIAVWQYLDNNVAQAQKNAALAASTGKQSGIVARFLTAPNVTPDQLRSELGSSNGVAGQFLLGYSLFLHRFYPDAAKTWRSVLDSSAGTDLRARAMLASSLDRAGQTAESRGITVQPFIPELGDLYAAISFDEMRRMVAR